MIRLNFLKNDYKYKILIISQLNGTRGVDVKWYYFKTLSDAKNCGIELAQCKMRTIDIFKVSGEFIEHC
jgi:hypothetical protein